MRMPTHADGDYKVRAMGVPNSVPVVSGALHEYDLRPGLSVQCASLRELTGMTVEATVAPGLGLVVLLDGGVDVWFDDSHLQLNAKPATAQGACIVRAESARFVRHSQQGAYARKVSLSIGQEWLAEEGYGAIASDAAMQQLLADHLAVRHWQPSRRAILLAEEMLRVPKMSPLLRHLYMESRSLALICEALGSVLTPLGSVLTPLEGVANGLSARDYRRMQALRELLESSVADEWDMEKVARHVGMNPTTLQRLFRQAFGTTVFDYVREYRLDRARVALEKGGLSVGQAAELAGYTSAANFSTAYRRRFGISPKHSKSLF